MSCIHEQYIQIVNRGKVEQILYQPHVKEVVYQQLKKNCCLFLCWNEDY